MSNKTDKDDTLTRQMEPLPPFKTRRTDISRYLRGMHPDAHSTDDTLNVITHNIKQIADGTGDLSQNYANLALAFAVFAGSYQDQLILLDRLAGENEKLRVVMQRSFSNRLSKAIMICENLGILNSGDPYWLADIICQIQDEVTARAAIAHIQAQGSEEDKRRLTWLKAALADIEAGPEPGENVRR